MNLNAAREKMRATRILVIRLSSIGDVVQCTAIPRHLVRRFSDAEIDWVVRSDNRELLALNPHIKHLVSFDRQRGFAGWRALCRELAAKDYTHVYDAHNNMRSFVLGTYLRWHAIKTRQPIYYLRRSKHRLKRFLLFWFKINLFAKNYTAVESYITPLQAWQITYDQKGGEIYVAAETTSKIKSLMREFEKNRPNVKWLAIAPATAWPKKNWPFEHWLTLVRQVLASTQYNIVILGGPGDGFCEKLVVNSERVLNLQGRLKLIESAAVAPLCQTLIAADTGILHMGEAMKQDVIAMLGPTPFGHPSRSTSIGLQKKLWCQPCSKDGSGPCINREFQKCMKLIEPTEVYESLVTLVNR